MKSAVLPCLLAGNMFLAARAADFTSTYVGGTRNWGDSASWTTPGAPAGTIPNNIASPPTTFDAVQNGGTLTVDVNPGITIQNFSLGGGTLSAAQPLNLNGTMTLSGGTLSGAATVTVSGRTTISAGTFMSSGGVLQADGGVDFTGNGLKNLLSTVPESTLAHEIRLGADSTWTGGEIRLDRASKLTIQSGVTLTHNFDGSLTQNTGNSSTLVNQGTFIKSATSATPTETFFGIALTNSGQILVNAGTLHFSGGRQRTHTSTGGLTAAAGTTIRFSNGSTTFDAGSTYAVAGTTLIQGGTTVFNNTASTGGLSYTAGTIDGSGTLTVTGPMTWTNGQMNGTGVTNINGGLAIAGAGDPAVGRPVNLNSNTNWTSGPFRCYGPLTNKAGRTFTKSFSGNLGSSGAGVFINEGTFTDTGTGTTEFACPITNSGTINLTGGTFTFSRGGTFHGSGTVNVGAGCLMILTNSNYTHNDGAIIAGSGTTRMTNTQTINGAVRVDTALELASTINVNGSGTLTVNGPTTWSNGAAALTGGGALNALGGMTFANVGDLRIENCTVNIGGNSQWTTGNIRMSGGQLINKAGGTFTTGIDANIFAFNGQGSVVNEGTFTKSAGTATPTNIQLPFTNGGTVNASGGTILFSSSYTQTAGALVLNGGSVSRGAGTFSITGGKIQGGGGITGGVSATGGAVAIEPGIGTTTGTLSVSGDLTLTNDSKLSFDLGGIVAGTQHDQLAENGSVALNLASATLEVSVLGAFFPEPADTFTVVDSNQNLTGTLKRADGTNIANGGRIASVDGKGTFQVNYTADKVILSNFQSVPTSLTLDDNQILENAPDPKIVGLLSATDPNPAATFTFALVPGTGDTDNNLFQINSNQLQARSTTVLDFETRPSYSIRLRVTNNSGGPLEQTFTIQVQDVPAPAALALSGSTFPENRDPGHVIGALSATNPPGGGDPVTFAVVSVDGSTTAPLAFDVIGSNLVTNASFDFENAPGPFNVLVKATNLGGESAQETFTVTLTNEGPTALALSSSSILEGNANAPVGDFSVTTIVPPGTAISSWELVPGAADNALFTLDGTALKTSATALDFEAAPTRTVRVRATDAHGESFSQDFAIQVQDVPAPAALALSQTSFPEGRPIGTTVGTFSVPGAEAGAAFNYSLTDSATFPNNGFFSIQNNELRTAELFDFDLEGALKTFEIRVRVADAIGEFRDETFTITLTNTGPTDISLTPASVPENLPANTVIGQLSALLEPADPMASPTFTLPNLPVSTPIQFSDDRTLVTVRPLSSAETPTITVRVRAEHLGEVLEKDITIQVAANPALLRVDHPFDTSLGEGSGTLDLGDMPLGQMTNRIVILRNMGPAHIFNLRIENPVPPANEANATSNDLSAPRNLAPGEAIGVNVTFLPAGFGQRSSVVTFASDNAPDYPLTLTGRGIGPEISVQQPIGTDLADGATFDFGRQPFGVEFPPRRFTVKNAGVVTSLNSIAATITGTDAAFFFLDTQGLANTLAAGASSTFRVTFRPEMDTLRSYNATLRIASNDADEDPFDIPLTGEGVTPLMIAQTAYAKASDASANAIFGRSVAVSGNTVIVGAANAPGGGAAYVFVRDSITGVWSQEGLPLRGLNTEAGDLFGVSVAISGNTAVIGATGEDSGSTGVNGATGNPPGFFSAGAAYVFQRSGGAWTQQAYLKASNTDQNDSFGYSVAISEDTVVVGAHLEDSGASGVNGDGSNSVGAENAGAAYVFQRSGDTWTQQAYLKASNTDGGDFFGLAVGVSGDTVVVGAYGEDSPAVGVNGDSGNSAGFERAGAAYVFQRSGAVWTQHAYLKASNTGAFDDFGVSVAVAGDTIVVGASGEDSASSGINGDGSNNSALSTGAAYVFERSGGMWTQQAYLKASNTGISGASMFGYAVSISDDTVVVGAFRDASPDSGVNRDGTGSAASINSGAACVFQRSGSAWTQQAYLKASNTGKDDFFGLSLGVSGNTVVSGAYLEDSAATGINGDGSNNSATDSGAAYIFEITSPEVFVHDGPDTGSPRLADNQTQAVDYGTTPLGIPVTRSYTISNLRALPLTVSSITVPSGYTVVNVPTEPIPAQGTAVFSVRQDALALGTNSGNVTITTNDSTNPDFVFPITGEVQALAVGSLDPRFGTGGVAKVDFAADDKAFDMLMLPDGRLVLGGERVDGAGSQFALARLLSKGALDTSFGGSGMVSMTVPGVSSPSITGICLQGDKIVAVGTRMMNDAWFSAPSQPSYALARYLPDGSLDSTFGTAGFDVDTSLTEGDFTWNIVTHPSGKLLVAGMHSGTLQAYVRRFNQNGGRDAGFGTNGTVLLSNGIYGGALTVNAAGDAFAAGSTLGTFRTRVWRINSTGGQVGVSFPQAAPAGYPIDAGASTAESATAVALQPDGKPVVAISRSGSFDRNRGHGFITGRATSGLALDLTYNGTGVKLEDIDPLVNREQANSIAVQKDGKLVAVGQVGGKWVVVRYTPTGELDVGFGTDGKVVLDLGASGSAYKVLLDAAGDIYVAGHASNGSNQDFVVVKLIGSVTHQSAIVVRNGSSVSSPVITSGQSTAISYGARQVSSPLAKVFLIENIGTLPLTIDSVTAPEHYRVGRRPTSVLPGASAFCEIVFKADSLGVFSGPVVITTNDPVHGTFTFPVTGEVVANAAPVYSPLTISTVEGKPVSVSLDKLVDQVTDANGDVIRIVRFDTFSEKGATITQADKSLVFSQPVSLAGTDTFKVRFSDGVAEVEGVVTVEVATDTTIPKNLPKIVSAAGGNVTLTFSGAADTTYSIQQSPNNVNFTQIGTAKTAKGKVVFTTTTPPPNNATFRIRQINTVATP